jgi:RND superfamily putative drug exporter
MRSFTRWVLEHRKTVLFSWLVVIVIAFASIQPAVDALSQEFNLPGRESTEANDLIYAQYGNGGPRVNGPLVPVVELPEGTTVDSPGVRSELGAAFSSIAAAVPGSRAADWASTGDRLFVSEDGRVTFGVLWYPPSDDAFDSSGPSLDAARAAAAGVDVAGAPVRVTGLDALIGGDEAGDGPSVLIETLVGGVGALVVLLAVFGSLMALVPLLMAAIAIPTTFLALWPIAEASQVSLVVQFLVALIGLGIAIDYALLIVMRWREAHGGGLGNRESVIEAMDHAGRAVIVSGVAVAIGLLALIVLPVPFLRSIGYGGMLIPLVSVLVGITLLPVLLDTIGPRLDRIGLKRRTTSTGQGWVPWGRLVVRRRWVVGTLAVAILAALMIPVGGFSTGTSRASALASSGPAREGLDVLERAGIGAGVLTPFDAVVEGGDPDTVARSLADADGVRGAVAPDGEPWSRGSTSIVNVFPIEEDSAATVDAVRGATSSTDGTVFVGGTVPANADFNDAVYGNFGWVVLVIILITFVLLARVFRSLVLPLKAIVFNVISIGAVWGFLVYFWQEGHGSGAIFGIEPTGALSVWIPIMVFAFLYGLSMDYEVFILSRMREEYDRDGSTDRAVVAGIARTGRLVTAGSLILFLAFLALASGPETEVKVFATALAIGILLDATVVRSMLLPAFVSVLGRWNWWMPLWAARILRVEPSSPAREERDGRSLDLHPPGHDGPRSAPVRPATGAVSAD